MAKTKAKKKELSPEREARRLLAEASLEEFIHLVQPRRLLGNIHREVINFWTKQDAKSHQLLLLPRDHGKSAMVAFRVAWELTRDPTLRILYISSTSNLAVKQLKFIKDILTCDAYRMYWPEMVEKEETKREKWTEKEIAVDDPRRKLESIRDPSIWAAGLTSNIVGMHCDIAVLDDVVVQSNAYLADGRDKVKDQYSLLSSIETGDAREWVVGTRYHPNDLYAELSSMMIERHDENGNKVSEEPLFEVMEEVVESAGDGTGEFLWPRQQSAQGKWYGFDAKILASKRAQYLNKTHFRAQYYNDPHDSESSPVQRDLFQYYEPRLLTSENGRWYLGGERLNIAASIDFAFTLNQDSDSTSIVVIGTDTKNNYYVLEIDRFKTNKISDYYKHIFTLYQKWGFRKIRAEVNVAQQVIVNDLKDNYIRPNGLALVVDEYRPSRWQGSKDERIMSILEPRYANKQIWHYKTGNIQLLEEELLYTNPAHDDIKDALASAIDYVQAPSNFFMHKKVDSPIQFHSRFGGVS